MRRIIIGLLVGILCFGVAGCGGQAKDMSDDTYKMGLRALDALDDYLDDDITAKEADNKLTDIYTQMENLVVEDEQETQHILISSKILTCNSIDLLDKPDKEVLKNRNELAKMLGEKKR